MPEFERAIELFPIAKIDASEVAYAWVREFHQCAAKHGAQGLGLFRVQPNSLHVSVGVWPKSESSPSGFVCLAEISFSICSVHPERALKAHQLFLESVKP